MSLPFVHVMVLGFKSVRTFLRIYGSHSRCTTADELGGRLIGKA